MIVPVTFCITSRLNQYENTFLAKFIGVILPTSPTPRVLVQLNRLTLPFSFLRSTRIWIWNSAKFWKAIWGWSAHKETRKFRTVYVSCNSLEHYKQVLAKSFNVQLCISAAALAFSLINICLEISNKHCLDSAGEGASSSCYSHLAWENFDTPLPTRAKGGIEKSAGWAQ